MTVEKSNAPSILNNSPSLLWNNNNKNQGNLNVSAVNIPQNQVQRIEKLKGKFKFIEENKLKLSIPKYSKGNCIILHLELLRILYEDNCFSVKPDWNKIVDLMTEQTLANNSVEENFEKLQRLQWTRKENYLDFIMRWNSIITACGLHLANGGIIKRYLLDCLLEERSRENQRLKDILSHLNTSTLTISELILIFKNTFADEKGTSVKRKRISEEYPIKRTQQTCDFCDKPGHSVEFCRKKKKMKRIEHRELQDHLYTINQVLKVLNDNNLKLKKEKCKFGYFSISVLGHIIGKGSIHPDPSKLNNLREYPIPATRKQLFSFIGSVNYLREYIPHYSEIVKPLNDLKKVKTDLKKCWKEEHQQAFDQLKQSLKFDVKLHVPNWAEKLYIATDASNYSIGAINIPLSI